MKERTIEEKLFHQLMRLERMMKRPEPERMMGRPGERRPAFARQHILFLIASYENGVHQKELIERIHVNPSSMSEFINRLEEDGYLIREADPADRRSTLLKLSDLGKARVAELQDERADRFEKLFGNLNEEEKETLSALLEKILPKREGRCHPRHRHHEEDPE